jgi:hypothetical protein
VIVLVNDLFEPLRVVDDGYLQLLVWPLQLDRYFDVSVECERGHLNHGFDDWQDCTCYKDPQDVAMGNAYVGWCEPVGSCQHTGMTSCRCAAELSIQTCV